MSGQSAEPVSSESRVELPLWPRQFRAFTSPATEILYGGGKGGGKSHVVRVCALVWCLLIPGLQVYLFRRTMPELRRMMIDGPTGFRAMLRLPGLQQRAKLRSESQIRFANGSIIHLSHMDSDAALAAYAGSGMHVLMIDQLEEWQEYEYRKLRAELRLAGVNVPRSHAGRFPRVLCTANPGGVGDSWIMEHWINPRPPEEVWQAGPFTRQYIPALVDDNPSLDELYESRLFELGDEALVRALRYGQWGVVAGGMFSDVWGGEPSLQVLPAPVLVPDTWERVLSFDWGSEKPASMGLWARSDGGVARCGPGGGLLVPMPRGSVVRLHEVYTVARQDDGRPRPNVGLRWSNQQLGQAMAELAVRDGVRAGSVVADPSIWSEQGAASIQRQIAAACSAAGVSLSWQKADNRRTIGWSVVRDLMRASKRGLGQPAEDPGLWVSEACRDWLRTVPSSQRDRKRYEDLDTRAEDHAADETRYLAAHVVGAPEPASVEDPGWL